MIPRILFITTPSNQPFAETLMDVVRPYGELDVIRWEAMPDLSEYFFVIVDAGVLADLVEPNSLTGLLEYLRILYPKVRMLVTTTTPSWKHTREALLAGAVDYTRQSLDPDSLRNSLFPILDSYIQRNKQF